MAELTLREATEKRLSALKTERDSSWLGHWRDVGDYILPRRGRFLWTDVNKGGKINDKIVDSTGTLALRTLASGLMSGLTSPARPWFRLGTPDPGLMEFGPVKTWLDQVTGRIRLVFAKSNVYNALHATYEELGGFGTGALCILEDREDLIRAYAYTAGEYMLANADRGSVNTLYREFPATVGQLVQWFGIDAVSPEVRGQWERGNPDQWILIGHAIEPNDGRAASPFAKDQAYRSVYWEANGPRERWLSRSGFSEFPVMAPRWQVTGTDVYGRSPGMEALPDVKMLQVQQKRKAQAIDKLVNPPMTAPTSLRNEPASVLPGSITYVDAVNSQQAGFRPAYEVNPRVGELAADIGETQRRIERAFYADLFLMLASSDRRQITAREVEERHEEKLLALGPVLERLHDELLNPLIDRTFAIMVRASVDRWAIGEPAPIPEPPKELAEIDLKVELVSTLAQAQRAVGLAGIERLLSITAAVAGAKPEVSDKIDGDQIIDEAAEMLGTPASIVLADDKVAELRAGRAKATAAAQTQTGIDQMAKTAKTLGDTKAGQGNLLEGIMNAVAGAGGGGRGRGGNSR